ncbi:Mannosyl-oligosaccharide alpha-1,2-mannosidase 1B [Conoideocrella luteorostrata]|uniref:alpha-1,2-Mannosidase n=1 Tax=Conoideocrella luteorostrata TaxID=1105319 RepID=A0AAJ0G212_9HYPO|nr:Mannosyl-oligosaccharide alpha-1,2-mannosidase 1B [Conoideocrella luteorostrata]
MLLAAASGSPPGRAWKRAAPEANLTRAHEVRSAFQTAWDGYYKHAFPHDTLLPISGGHEDDRNAWGVTAVDTLSTAIIIEDVGAVNQILRDIETIDFSTTKGLFSSVSLFETNIRYLAGLLSGYDLLTGPSRHLVDSSNSKYVETLLRQARTLADSLSIAFNTPTGIPDDSVYLNPIRGVGGSETNSPAGAGTLVLEWTRLSDLTGNKTYATLAQKAQKYLIDPQGEGYPGLVGRRISIRDGKFKDNTGSWGASVDSFYEYLIKMYLYDPKEFAQYKDQWVLAADSTIKYLVSHPSSRPDLTFLAGYNGKITSPSSGHLASFAGGNFIVGGVILNEPRYTRLGLSLAESYYQTYKQTASHIGPESFQWVATNTDTGPPAGDADFYKRAGFWPTSKEYTLRPETIESLYYAYRVTGDKKYQDMAWDAFLAIRDQCKAGYGFSGLTDVTKENGGTRDDFQQSFFLSEVLKYSYLIFAGDSEVQFQAQGKNGFVFNTEAHPLKVRG